MPARKPKPGESFGDLFPEIAKEWHPTKNGNLTPFNFSKGSHLKVWWKCYEDEDHEWMASIGHRSTGRGCPVCVGKKVVNSNCLATTHPFILSKWHPTKNKSLNPFNVTAGSGKKVWWKCPKGDDHEWLKSISEIVLKNKGCPICSGHKVVKSNCLATTHPEVTKEWHPTKNGDFTAFKLTKGNVKKVWWKCPKGDDHEWLQSPNSRLSKSTTGCPICNGKKVVESNNLYTLFPKLAKEWHLTKNGSLNPEEVTPNSSKKVWWKCPKGNDHEWLTSINHRTNGTKCPFCENQKVSKTNNFLYVYPELAEEWHATKNGDFLPEHFVSKSNKNVWWQCPEGEDHEWETSIGHRTGGRKTGCPVCFGFKVVNSNSLDYKFPKIAEEFHPTKNGNLISKEIFFSSAKKIWWKCKKGIDHEWKTTVYHRTINNSDCPYCTLTPQSKQELIITHELITIFTNINPKGFKLRIKGKLWSIDIYIPDLKIGIEFDGSYWHKDKRDLDKLKTEELEAEGFNIIRVRQKPLKRIFEDDIMAEKKYDGKKITNDVLKQILKDYKLGQSTILKINKYIEKSNLQNEKGLEKYIDMILTEKSEKK